MVKLKEIYFNHKFKAQLSILTFLFLISCFWAGFVFLSFGYALYLVASSSMEDGLSVLIFSIPFIDIGRPTSYIFYLLSVLTFVVKAYVIMYVIEKKKPNKLLLITMGMFLAYALLPFSAYNLNLFIKLTCIILLFLLVNLFLEHPEKLRLQFNISVLTVGLLFSTMFLLAYPISPYLKEVYKVWDQGEYVRFCALLPNPNPLAMMCEITLGFLTYFIVRNKATQKDWWCFVVLSVMGIATVSKTFLIIYLVMLLILFFYFLNKYPKVTGIAFFGVLTIFGLLVVFKNPILFRYIDRFIGPFIKGGSLEQMLNVITTGRYALWRDYFFYTVSNPLIFLFGAGLGAPKVSVDSAHNLFIMLMYNLGVVGVFLLVLIIVSCVRVYVKRHPTAFSWATMAPILIISLLMMVEDLFMYTY